VSFALVISSGFSSGRRETPYLDAKARTRTPSRRNVTTETPFSTIAPGDYSMATSPKHAETTTAATTTTRKVYESGEDLTLDSFADEEDDDLDDDDDDDEVDADDDEIDGGYDDGDDEIYGYSNEANVTSKNLIRGEGTNRTCGDDAPTDDVRLQTTTWRWRRGISPRTNWRGSAWSAPSTR
jgi:hypothetical protein